MSEDRLEKLFAEYARYHRDPVNRAAHLIGFPLLFMGGFGLLDHAGLGLAAYALFTLVNAWVEWRLALVTAFLSGALYALGAVTPVPVLIVILSAGVTIPVLGHVIFEKRWPDTPGRLARFELVGHLWFVDRYVGVRDI